MPTAREGLLDALEELLIEEGERAATLDAVATRARVSKGGLLYHFASKAALIDGLVARMQDRAEQDAAAMRDSPDGPAAYYVRTSAQVGSAFDQTLLAAFRLAPGSESRVTDAIQGIRVRWLELITEEVGDRDLALAILLMGDGLYYSASLALDSLGGQDSPTQEAAPVAAPDLSDIDSLLRVVSRMRGVSGGD
ncbi:TetR/AcrR family transcriptional regulator [Janibacter alittae]|uniref:TetR/AcrR family transcriptional regulator n=1 Tax=Janibacter alittae TaxID=3115209 RepID=A0ABZ2MKW1_9MICO